VNTALKNFEILGQVKTVYRYFHIGQVSACRIAKAMTHQYRSVGRLGRVRGTPRARANRRSERGVK